MRKSKRITQDEFAKRINLTRQSVWEIETFRVKVKVGTFVKIAVAFNVPVQVLLQYVLDHAREED